MDTNREWLLRAIGAGVLVVLATMTVSAAQGQEPRGELVFERSLAIGTGGTLMVDVADADVTIEPGQGDQVEVDVFVWSRDAEWGREMFDRMEFEASESRGSVRVTARDPRIRRSEWREHRSLSVTVRARVPGQTALDVRTGDGDVEIGSIDGRATIRTGDGDVRVRRLHSDRISVETADGDISADELVADRVTVRTSDGDIDLASVAGELEARTNDGDIRVDISTWGGALISSGDGDITIIAPDDLAADVEISGEDFSIDRELHVVGRLSRRMVRGTLNGGGPRLVVRTGDGSVALRRN